MSKNLALILSLIMAISSFSLMIFKPILAQSVPTPAVPQFSSSFQYNPDASARTQSNYIANAFINVRISNQHFTPFLNASNYPIQLYYDFRWRPHNNPTYENDSSWEDSLFLEHIFPAQDSSGDNTKITIGFTRNTNMLPPYANVIQVSLFDDSVDIQVQACTGYITRNFPFPTLPRLMTHIL